MKIVLNFFAVVLLIITVATPIYFARNFAKVAGIKSGSKYLVVSQVEKFPNLTFSQNQNSYAVSFTKYGPNQAFLGVLIINNPTPQTQNYTLETTSGSAKVFFGQDLNDQRTKITAPAQSSAPLSLISQESSSENQKVEFRILVK